MKAAPLPAEGVICWNVNTECNYRCSYCTQRFKEDRHRQARDLPRFLDAFRRLPGRFEVKLSGGEPTLHPGFLEIVTGLAEMGHRVSLVTNLSSTPEFLAEFAAAGQGRIGIVACSLHPEYVSIEEDLGRFLDQAAALEDRLRKCADSTLPKPAVSVTMVATRSRLALLPEIARIVVSRGLRFKVQPEKQNRDLIDYSAEETALLESLGGHNLTGVVRNSFKGGDCWAGSRFFILDDKGVACRCYPARRFRLEPTRDFLDPVFKLMDLPTPCLYDYCNCTVPIARGMTPRADVECLEEES